MNLKETNIELVKSIYRARINEEKHHAACDDMNQISALGNLNGYNK